VNQRLSAENLLLCPAEGRMGRTSVLTENIKYSSHTLNSTIGAARTDEEHRFLTVLTRAVDDSGWLEETTKSSRSEEKVPILIEIIKCWQ
jgi:hypothetical protein